MNIFEILREAKNPSPKNKTITVSTNKQTDYTEDADPTNDTKDESSNTDDSTTDDAEGTDYTADVSETTPDDATGDTGDETSDDGTEDTGDGTDYTDDATGDTGDETSDDGTEDTGEEEPDPEKEAEEQRNRELLNDTINVYYSIQSVCSKLDEVNYAEILANRINSQVKRNLISLCEYIFKFITGPFSTNTYVKNLYIYNYIIETYKIGIRMLSRINNIQEKQDKNKKK